MNFAIDVTPLESGSSDSLEILIEARMGKIGSSETFSAVGDRTRFNLIMPLKTVIDVEVLGYF